MKDSAKQKLKHKPNVTLSSGRNSQARQHPGNPSKSNTNGASTANRVTRKPALQPLEGTLPTERSGRKVNTIVTNADLPLNDTAGEDQNAQDSRACLGGLLDGDNTGNTHVNSLAPASKGAQTPGDTRPADETNRHTNQMSSFNVEQKSAEDPMNIQIISEHALTPQRILDDANRAGDSLDEEAYKEIKALQAQIAQQNDVETFRVVTNTEDMRETPEDGMKLADRLNIRSSREAEGGVG